MKLAKRLERAYEDGFAFAMRVDTAEPPPCYAHRHERWIAMAQREGWHDAKRILKATAERQS